MNDVVGTEDITTRCGCDSGQRRAVRSVRRAFFASFEATFGAQDAPRA